MCNYRSSNPYEKLKYLKIVHQYEKFDFFVLPKYKIENNLQLCITYLYL